MDLVKSIRNTYLHNFANFEGRASKSEFWYGVLFNLIALIIIIFLTILLGILYYSMNIAALPSIDYGSNCVGGFMIIGMMIYVVAFTLPNIAVCVRRLHDTGKGGGWFCILLVPYIGFIWLLILCSCKGQDKANRFGEVPE